MVEKKPTKILIITVLLLSLQSGCSRFRSIPAPDYRTVDTSAVGRPVIACKKHEKAIFSLGNHQYAAAEKLLHEALIADASYGPAHNTLGKVYYEQRRFYLAAWEFEHAIKAMPDRAEPINNLGLVYEAVGKLDEAVVQYELAKSIEPEHPEYFGNLLRCRIRRGEPASTMRPELQSLIALDDRPEWVSWAKLKLTTDKTNQDWCQSAYVKPDRTDESFSSEHFLDAAPLPVEYNELPIEMPVEMPTEPQLETYEIEVPAIESDDPILRQLYDAGSGSRN